MTYGQAVSAVRAYAPPKEEIVDTWSTQRAPIVHTIAQKIEANGFTNTGRVDRFDTRNNFKRFYSAVFGGYLPVQVGGGKNTARKTGQTNAEIAADKANRKAARAEKMLEEKPSIEFRGAHMESFVQGKAAQKAAGKH